jgi:predicted amidohydrolase
MATHESRRVVTVAAVNWKGEWGIKAANLDKMMSKVKEASQIGANMVCFPELALSGYECGEEAGRDKKPCAMHREAAETIPGPSTEEMSGLAKALGMYVIFGMPERDPKDSNTCYNSVAIVGPEGILGSYRKLHLAPPPKWTEFFCFKKGSDLPLFETAYGPIGIQICADFWTYPELSRILFLKGANLIFNPAGSASGPGKIDNMTLITPTRGKDNLSYVVSVNHVGKERTISYYGHSTIAGPAFPRPCKVFAQGGAEEEIVSATLNFDALAKSRKMAQVKERGNWKLIAREYQRVGEILMGDRE